MKKLPIIFLLTLLCSVVLFQTSCSKDKEDSTEQKLVDDKPGEIPGLGEQPGELTGMKYELPDGITLEGEITGYNGVNGSFTAKKQNKQLDLRAMTNTLLSNLKAETIAENKADISRGSGYYVRLAIRLKNSKGQDKKIDLPAGLIVKSRTGKYQNGVLLKKVSFTVPANSTKLLDLRMYCGNEQKYSSSAYEKYDFAVISNSRSLNDLINQLKTKKINIEQYDFNDAESLGIYSNYANSLQGILWNLTDNDGLTEDDMDYINKIQND